VQYHYLQGIINVIHIVYIVKEILYKVSSTRGSRVSPAAAVAAAMI
jgi:hypothetical protein